MTRQPALLAAALAWCLPAVALGQPIAQSQQSYGQPVATMGPDTLPYHEDQPIPPGYTRQQKARLGLIVSGAVTLGTTYLLSVVAFAIDDSGTCFDDFDDDEVCNSDLWPLAIPVLGPFVTMGTSSSEGIRSLLLLDGLAQVSGLAMVILGITLKTTVLVRNDLASVQLAPLAFEGSLRGMALAGRF